MIDQRRPTVALPETRQLDVLANLLERRGVDVLRCPMIAIKDAPNREEVVSWLERLCGGMMGLFVVYTGEGIERLASVAEGADLKERFVAALESTSLLTRGPKPARALRQFGVKPSHPAVAPTTEGVIETLDGLEIEGKRIGVQLYGAAPLPQLTHYIERRSAIPDCVAPYVYASESDDTAVESLTANIVAGEVDAIAFTSKSQVERLAQVVERIAAGSLAQLLEPVIVAAVGPVAAAELKKLGVAVDVVPESDYFMKPMVSALMHRLSG